MRKHYIDDLVITLDDVRKAEQLQNNHARFWVRFFQIGSSISEIKRCSRALMANYVMIPSLEGSRKDHKPNIGGDPILGPKMKPLCAANRAPNAAFSNLVSMVTRALGDSISETSGEVISGEEVKRKIEDLNTEHKLTVPRVRPSRPGKEIPLQDQENMIIY